MRDAGLTQRLTLRLVVLSACVMTSAAVDSEIFKFYDNVPPPDGVIDLFLGGFFPMSGTWAGGQTIIPVFEYALDMINNRKDILPGYRLVLHWADTQCKCGKAINEMHRVVFNGPTKLMAVGAGCPTCTEATAG
ncbi:PREDICTED: gamma-aminobutyric acid type B receptor subunit 1-like, partial [Priapulus caudatus]|uniref:Gamma-aminobutyric acid type B receptor subunit 1-like n=1 Tax=Priapulus caudatus TaxID=37621 RepID=A0ABM1F6R6_PRICU